MSGFVPGGEGYRAQYTASFNSFSGVDMRVFFGKAEIGELQGVSVTITREKAPLYTMGNPNPRAFSRGKRGIAGSLIFLVFDREAFISAMRSTSQAGFMAWPEEASFEQKTAGDGDRPTLGSLRTSSALALLGNQDARQKSRAEAWYADQILPFDIVVTAENEYGAAAQMAIIGVEILNAGSGMSVDDINADTNMTFVARECIPWTPLLETPPISEVKQGNLV